MKYIYTFILIIFTIQLFGQKTELEKVPLRPEENFELKLDYEFKKKPPLEAEEKNYRLTNPMASNSDLLPFLTVSVTLKNTVNGEVRYKILSNSNGYVKMGKLKDKPIVLEIGYATDVLEGVAPNQYFIILQTQKRNSIDKIEILIEKDGTFKVNGRVNGKI